MTSTFITSSSMATKQAIATPRRGLIVANASRGNEVKRVNLEVKNKEESGRRDIVVGAIVAAAYSIAKVAMADEPKAGTPEAKKKYAPVCVTMPTARICHK